MSNMKLLILEDSRDDAALIQATLKRAGLHFIIKVVAERDGFIDALDSFVPEFILSDHSLPGFSSTQALAIAREKLPHVPFILVTGTVSEEFAANIIKSGADDYILKDRLKRLPVAIGAALKQRRVEKEKEDVVAKLIQSEEKYRTIFLKSPLPKWIYDFETLRFLDVNEAAIHHYGYTQEEFLSMTIKDIRSAKDIELLLNDLTKIPGDPDIRQGAWKHLKKNGELIIVETTAHSIDYNNMKARMVVINDITAKIKAEQQKEFDSNNLKALINNTNDLMWSVDKDLKLMTFNDSFNKTIELMSGKPLTKGRDILSTQFTEDQLVRYKTYYGRALSGETFTIIDHFVSQVEVWAEISFYPIRQGDAVIGTACFSRDITERKKAEEELRKSNERFKYATQATSDIIWEQNFETKEYLVHEGKEKLFGFNKILNWQLGLDGKSIVEEDRRRVRKSFLEARKDPACELWQDEYSVHTPDNTILHLINHAILFRNEQGKAIRAIGAITDITEKKKLEAELFEQQRKEQSKITATALEAQEKERHAIGMELHDNVNQILVGTKLLLSMVKTDPEKNKNLVNSCMDNIQSAVDENRKIAHTLVSPDFEANILADQIFNLTDNMLKKAAIDIHIDTASLREESLNDDQKLAVYRIAQEQCTNIIKYAKASVVNISLSTANDLFRMIIADDGIGMETGKKTKGIGLRNINGRLSIFNGTANINTAPGKGFSLEITIPLKK